MGIRNALALIKQLPKKTGEKFAESSFLNQTQIEALEKRKIEYLSSNSQGKNALETIAHHLSVVDAEVFRTYLPMIHQLYLPLAGADGICSEPTRIFHFDITKWVTDAKEDNIEKLSNVYQVLSGEDCNIALIYTRTMRDCRVTMAISSDRDKDIEPSVVRGMATRLQSALSGNFPGSEYHIPDNSIGTISFPYGSDVAIASVSNLATEKSEKFICQSMEKLLDGIIPSRPEDEYSIVLLAHPIGDITPHVQCLFDQYSAISPFAQIQTQFSLSESASAMSNTSIGGHIGLSMSHYHGTSQNAGFSIPHIPMSLSFGVNSGGSIGGSIGLQLMKTYGTTEQRGMTKGNTTTYTNYSVKHTMELIEGQMKRLEQCQALGMWDFAAYVISPDRVMAQNVAHMYVALTQGKESYMEQSAINLWGKEKEEKDVTQYILNSLSSLHHPVFELRPDCREAYLSYPATVDATTMLSGSELAHALNFPRKSVAGFPVIECVRFGRNPLSKDTRDGAFKGNIHLGCVHHMLKDEKNIPVDLSPEALTMHTFITGSTGSGKSNTVYQMISQLKKQGAAFLVIEPAKGEYKNVFGHRKNVSVYGTNPEITELLRINPFSFPREIHIYEHLDRLVEIFNVCWPMYAAMPAVLKDSIERAYVDAGWDMKTSRNKYDDAIFPTFGDVLRQIDIVMDESQYSADSKGDYKGALSTRLRSLTNGIDGMLFTAHELPPEELFDKNVIVDISRVGSTETKSMIMGILVMKLQEYRMAQRAKAERENPDFAINEGLKHVTVLEEAHNLLKRTSPEQSSESSNLTGKAVEMITNAIAEMRTYGEGFIIADQAPGLLDMAAIRNTNTKIILRLPEYSDRALVGRAAGLNDDQIDELARLKKGVAAVYQNDWIESVLCAVDKFDDKEKAYIRPCQAKLTDDLGTELLSAIAKNTLSQEIEKFDRRIITSNLPAKVRCDLLDYRRSNDTRKISALALIAYDFFNSSEVLKKAEKISDGSEWMQYVKKSIQPSVATYSDEEVEFIIALIVTIEMQLHPEREKRLFEMFQEGRLA